MRFQKNVVNSWRPQYNKLSQLNQLIKRSNLLGEDLKVTNFGGGNTSSKIIQKDPITKKNETILYVKGSGGDLGSIKEDGFASLYLDKLNGLKNIYRGFNFEDEMVGYYPMCTFNNNPRAASIDTPLHAYVPYPEVDHTHPDSIIALATMKNGRDIVKKVYQGKLGWLDWQRPGFDLGLKMEKLIQANPTIIGIVLGHHGLFTWGPDSQSCYSSSIALIKKAQTYLNDSIKKYSFGKPKFKKKSTPDFESKLISTIRGHLSKENSKILHIDQSDITLEFVNSTNLKKVASVGTSCPDHFLRTKRLPLVLPSLTELEKNEKKISEIIEKNLDKYKEAYTKYYNRNKSKGSPNLRDPYPVIVLIPEYGMMSFAKNKPTARVASEFFCNAINVMKGAEGISSYTGLTEREAFRIEYWDLEEAKLKRMPPEKELAGKVALITGAAGGIGSASALKFLKEGCCVVLTDIDKKALQSKHKEFSAQFGKDVVRSYLMDVTKEQDVKKAVSESTKEFGGIDMKKLFLVVISSILFAFNANAADMRIALVVKGLGIGFFEAAAEGGQEAAAEIGGVEVIYTGPATTTAEAQIEVINSLIAQKVDAIAISANDRDALASIGKKAMDRGITVISWDSGIAEEGRVMNLDPSNTALIGSSNIKWMKNSMGDEGEFAILSATSQATNQNAWIEEMKKEFAKPEYSKMKWVDTVYGDDLFDKSYQEALGLFKKYPNLKGIIAPTSVGIVAAAKAVEDQGLVGKVFVTGLGLPSEMQAHVKSGAAKQFGIWNPIDLGYSAVYLSHQIATGAYTGQAGECIPTGRMGEICIGEGNNAAMADPFIFDASNIDKFAAIF